MMNTVCEPISIQDAVSGEYGRSDLTNYYKTDYWLLNDYKQLERERVASFILSYFEDQGKIRLLSMPGISWAFETLIKNKHPKVQIIALEKSVTAYYRSRVSMTSIFGAEQNDYYALQDRSFTYGRAELLYSRASAHAKKTNTKKGLTNVRSWRSNRLLLISTQTFFTMLTTDYGARLIEKKHFNEKFNMRNAVWLDFTSQLCKSVEETIANLHWCLDANDEPKPVVITLMNARDSFAGVDKRVQRILDLQPRLVYVNHWTYSGVRGTPMLTICGTIAV